MKNFKRATIAASALIALLVVTGCGEHVPRTVFEVETKDGQVIKLACPVIDPGRSTFTYIIEGYCTVYN